MLGENVRRLQLVWLSSPRPTPPPRTGSNLPCTEARGFTCTWGKELAPWSELNQRRDSRFILDLYFPSSLNGLGHRECKGWLPEVQFAILVWETEIKRRTTPSDKRKWKCIPESLPPVQWEIRLLCLHPFWPLSTGQAPVTIAAWLWD